MSNSKKYIDIRVVGQLPELQEFLRVCKLIQTFGTRGTSRTVKVRVDGDGSGRLRFFILNDSKEMEISSFNQIEDEDEFEVSIGE